MFREVQIVVEELRSLAKDKEEIKGDWCSFDMLRPPMFIGEYFVHWIIKMVNFLRAKELIEYKFNNPYDEVCDVLALNFVKQALDDKFLCKITKAKTYKEAWKILEA